MASDSNKWMLLSLTEHPKERSLFSLFPVLSSQILTIPLFLLLIHDSHAVAASLCWGTKDLQFNTGQGRWGGGYSGLKEIWECPKAPAFHSYIPLESKAWMSGKDTESKWQKRRGNQMVLEGRRGEWKEPELWNKSELLVSEVTRHTTLAGVCLSRLTTLTVREHFLCLWHKVYLGISPWDNKFPYILSSAASSCTAWPSRCLSSPPRSTAD